MNEIQDRKGDVALKKQLVITFTGGMLATGLLLGKGVTASAQEQGDQSADDGQPAPSEWIARAPEEIEIHDPEDYEIQWGDTLWSISLASGVTIEMLADQNDIENPDLIIAGESLVIEEGDTQPADEDAEQSQTDTSRTGDGAVFEDGNQPEEESGSGEETEAPADSGETGDTGGADTGSSEAPGEAEGPEEDLTAGDPESSPTVPEGPASPGPADPAEEDEAGTDADEPATDEPAEVAEPEQNGDNGAEEEAEEDLATGDAENHPTVPEGPASPGADNDESAQETDATEADLMLELVNEARTEEGLSPLQFDDELNVFASFRTADMSENEYFSHDSPEHGSFNEMIEEQGLGDKAPIGENIAQGYSNVDQVFESWMESPEHRENMMNPNYNYFGMSYEPSGNYWVQVFSGE